jgi:ElaB/YqjD/DUF883 family membrane-anchored ribosome-binding protein
MSYQNQQPAMYSRTGDWFMDAARRKPEALLLLAAGCALLMRTSRRPVGWVPPRMAMGDQGHDRRESTRATSMPSGSSRLRGGFNEAAETAAEYAGDLKDKVADAASGYAATVADAVSDYADNARRNLSAGSDRVMSRAHTTYQTASEAIREQPIMIAALGLVAGAAVAALLPATEVERRTLGVARDAIAEVAGKAGETLIEAAGEAGDRLKEGAAKGGVDSEGLKELARDVGGTFTSAATGKSEQTGNPVAKGAQPKKGGSVNVSGQS